MSDRPTTPAPLNLRTLKQAAEVLHLSYSTVHKWTRTGQLPSVKMGSRVYIPDLEAVITQRTKPAVVADPQLVVTSAPTPSASSIEDLLPEERVFS